MSLPRSRVVNTSAAIEDQFIVTESITHSHGDGGEHSHEGLASYVWLDPVLAIAQADAIASAVIARDLGAAQDVEARLDMLRSELTELDAMAQEVLSSVQDVTIVATHPRYQYFARRYGLSVISLEWEAGAMPGDDAISELAQIVEENDARILIWEAEPPVAAIEAAQSLGLQSVVFNPWASQGAAGSFLDAYKTAVSGIAGAMGQGSN